MRRGLWFAVVAFFLTAGVAGLATQQGDTDYWTQIKAHLEAANRHPVHGAPDAEAAAKYLDSLSAEQLMEAGRQASAEIDAKFARQDWPMASMSLAFFWPYYPDKTNKLADIGPPLADLQDADQTPFWRWFLTDMLTRSWDKRGLLRDEQRRQVGETLMRLSQQVDVPAPVLAEATRGVPRLLASMQKALPPQKEGEGPDEARQRLAVTSQEYAQTGASLLARKGAPAEVQREAIGGLVRVCQLGLEGKELALKALGDAARDYAAYPEELWPQVMLAADRTDAVADISPLLGQAEKAAKEKSTLERLQTVRSVAALDGPTAGATALTAKSQPGLHKLSDSSAMELLAMAGRSADGLATNSVSDRAWSGLSAVVEEYRKRSQPAD